jgi:thiol:disulfide interchange protein
MKYICALIIFGLSAFSFAIEDREYNKKYDPARNAFADFEMAKRDAKTNGKLILVEFGGDWCIWCRRIEKFMLSTPDINKGIDDVFVLLKVNVSDENKNEKFVNEFPAIKGYPFFVIVDSNGVILESQNTGALEEGKGYSVDKFKAFIAKWKKAQSKN